MKRRRLLTGLAAAMVLPGAAIAGCARTQCDPVDDNSFTTGTVNRQPDCTIDFRLPDDVYRSIRRSDGTSEWTLRLMTLNSSGQPRWSIAHRVDNSQVRRQSVYFGTHVITYITCDLYTGWLTTGPIRSCGIATFRRVNWDLDYRDLDALQHYQDL